VPNDLAELYIPALTNKRPATAILHNTSTTVTHALGIFSSIEA